MEATTVTQSMVSAFGTVASDAIGAVQAVLPIALPVMGAFVVIKVGIKIFKSVTGK